MKARVAIISGLAFVLSGCSRWLEYDSFSFYSPDASVDSSSLDASMSRDASADSIDDVGEVDAVPDAATDVFLPDVADAQDSEPLPNPCDSISCSGKGTCEVRDGGAACVCDSGFHAEGLECKPDETCEGKECGVCSTCKVIDGKAVCTCPDGFKHSSSGCWPDPDPCDTKDCGPDAVCVPVSHCSVYGGCHQKCDCSNCGNCDVPDWVQYCGSDKYPPTKECNDPCPPGSGCCMFSQPFCWPGECCQSL